MSKAAYNVYAAGGAATPTYIEDVFSTYLYTGNGGTQTITNGIDLSTKGGLVWTKCRNVNSYHGLIDTARGVNNAIYSNVTTEQQGIGGITAFNTNGYSLDNQNIFNDNSLSQIYASWTFRKQPKFFDIVTYTGNSTASRQISHNLGSTPGCIIIKSTTGGTAGYPWIVWHTSLSVNTYLQLNATDAAQSSSAYVSAVSSTTFTINSSQAANLTGDSYVAYLFAHNAGGFGLTGSDNVISCGSYTGNGAASNPITLGYEPQWVLLKRTDITGDWGILDTMRGWSYGDEGVLKPNTSGATDNGNTEGNPTATGFDIGNGNYNINTRTYIYVAIRRGPMKTPTTGTSVFYPTTYTGNSAQSQNVGFNGDLLFIKQRQSAGDRSVFVDRPRGLRLLDGANSTAEYTPSDFGLSDSQFPSFTKSNNISNYAYIPVGDAGWNGSTNTYFNYVFRRAPGFFDIVCYSGSGSTSAVSHNLGVQPELIFYKSRTNNANWIVHTPDLISQTKFLRLNSTDAAALNSTQAYTNSGTPTSTTITPGSYQLNTTSWTYVAYLFATCPGVSKVGTYTGNGSSQTIDCGFAAGARFILIKRTDNTGYWYVFDTARGIVSGNDPFSLNLASTETTGYDLIDPANSGFIVNDDATYPINASGGTYIFLAIA